MIPPRWRVGCPIVFANSKVAEGSPTLNKVSHHVTHIILVGGGFYCTFGRQYHPGKGAILRSYLFIHLYALLVTPLNLHLGTNYFFTLAAPKQLGWIHQYPHWLFLAVVSLVFLGLSFLMYLPFRRLRRHAGTA